MPHPTLPRPKIRKELKEQIRQCLVAINHAERDGQVHQLYIEISKKNKLIDQAFVESKMYGKVHS